MYDAAGGCYEECGDIANAVACYSNAEEWSLALKCLLKAGRPIEDVQDLLIQRLPQTILGTPHRDFNYNPSPILEAIRRAGGLGVVVEAIKFKRRVRN